MPFAPTRRMPIEIIALRDGWIAPEGADWARLILWPECGCDLAGGLPDQPGVMSRYGTYPNLFEARDAAISYAMERGCRVLYVEQDA